MNDAEVDRSNAKWMRHVLRAAGVYNLVWGLSVVLIPLGALSTGWHGTAPLSANLAGRRDDRGCVWCRIPGRILAPIATLADRPGGLAGQDLRASRICLGCRHGSSAVVMGPDHHHQRPYLVVAVYSDALPGMVDA